MIIFARKQLTFLVFIIKHKFRSPKYIIGSKHVVQLISLHFIIHLWCNMSFTILEFKDGLQLVPTGWLDDEQGKCFFPPFLSLQRITKSIEEQEKPESDWRVYNVKKIFGTAATYKQGLRKLNVATRFFEIDDEDESFEEPKKIKLSNHKQYAGGSSEECPYCKKLESPLQVPKYVPHDQNIQVLLTQPIYSGAESSHLHSKINLINSDLNSLIMKKENHESFDCQKYLENFEKQILKRLDNLSVNLEAINKMNKNAEIENNMNEKLRNIDKITEKFETFEKKLENISYGKFSDSTFDIFPLSSIEALEQFERDLKDKNYFAQMVKYFGRFGGLGKNAAASILEEIISVELTKECDWRGLNNKKAFSKLKLNLVVLEALKIHWPFAKKGEVYNTIAMWLLCTKMKIEQREKRKRKSLPAKLE